MKKDKNKTKMSMFYDTVLLFATSLIFVIFFSIVVCAYIFKWEITHFKASTDLLKAQTLWPVFFIWALFCLRRRRLDEKGISALYFGIKYKHINWSDLQSVERAIIGRKCCDKTSQTKYRNMLVFTSKPKSNGKCTGIMIEEHDELKSNLSALVEKYYGPIKSPETTDCEPEK